MRRIAEFMRVSYAVFEEDMKKYFPAYTDAQIRNSFLSVKIPERATAGSAGYDFSSTADVTLQAGDTVTIPTGIRVRMQEDYALFLFPRSGLGFKYRLQLNNTVGVIDSDYYYSDNEGHILIKLTNDSKEGKTVILKAGSAFVQGIFLPYGITESDNVKNTRNGGFGSTG